MLLDAYHEDAMKDIFGGDGGVLVISMGFWGEGVDFCQ